LAGDSELQLSVRNEYRRRIMERSAADSIARGNRLTLELQRYVLEVRETQPGRAAIESLMGDPDPDVRLNAARDTLKWNPEIALPVIGATSQGAGLRAFEAGAILRLYRNGTLDLDWRPPEPQPRHRRRLTTAQIRAVEAFHSQTMAGGFLRSFVAAGDRADLARSALKALGFQAASALVGQAIEVAGPLAASHDERARRVDGLPDEAAARLEALGDAYQSCFPSDGTLDEAIADALPESRQGGKGR
jgi:hypothetical protein